MDIKAAAPPSILAVSSARRGAFLTCGSLNINLTLVCRGLRPDGSLGSHRPQRRPSLLAFPPLVGKWVFLVRWFSCVDFPTMFRLCAFPLEALLNCRSYCETLSFHKKKKHCGEHSKRFLHPPAYRSLCYPELPCTPGCLLPESPSFLRQQLTDAICNHNQSHCVEVLYCADLLQPDFIGLLYLTTKPFTSNRALLFTGGNISFSQKHSINTNKV